MPSVSQPDIWIAANLFLPQLPASKFESASIPPEFDLVALSLAAIAQFSPASIVQKREIPLTLPQKCEVEPQALKPGK